MLPCQWLVATPKTLRQQRASRAKTLRSLRAERRARRHNHKALDFHVQLANSFMLETLGSISGFCPSLQRMAQRGEMMSRLDPCKFSKGGRTLLWLDRCKLDIGHTQLLDNIYLGEDSSELQTTSESRVFLHSQFPALPSLQIRKGC